MNKEDLIHMDPGVVLIFTQHPTGMKAYLTITNVAEDTVAYKVKTTAPRYYVVKPNSGVLSAGDQTTIDINLVISEENKVGENKFLVQATKTNIRPNEYNVAPAATQTQMLNNFWQAAPKQGIKSFKLRVAVGGPTAGGAAQTLSTGAPVRSETAFDRSHTAINDANDPNLYKSATEAPSGYVGGSITSQSQAWESPQNQPLYERARGSDELNEDARAISVSEVGSRQKISELEQHKNQVDKEKDALRSQINGILNQQSHEEKKDSDGHSRLLQGRFGSIHVLSFPTRSHSNSKQGSDGGYQLYHLLIVAVVCLLIGSQLGGGGGSAIQ